MGAKGWRVGMYTHSDAKVLKSSSEHIICSLTAMDLHPDRKLILRRERERNRESVVGGVKREMGIDGGRKEGRGGGSEGGREKKREGRREGGRGRRRDRGWTREGKDGRRKGEGGREMGERLTEDLVRLMILMERESGCTVLSWASEYLTRGRERE